MIWVLMVIVAVPVCAILWARYWPRKNQGGYTRRHKGSPFYRWVAYMLPRQLVRECFNRMLNNSSNEKYWVEDNKKRMTVCQSQLWKTLVDRWQE